jgi:ferric iron reductase protein FhuF
VFHREAPGRSGETGAVEDVRQAAVAARIPGAAALGLVAPASPTVVPATALADVRWTAEVLRLRARSLRTRDPRVLATVWWYSASSVLFTPVLAGLATGTPLSARPADLSLSVAPDGLPVAAVAGAAGGNPADDLRTTLSQVVAAVAEAGGVRQRPLWAIATDSVAGRLLDLGRALGDVAGITALAAPLAAAVGAPLPAPRYVDVGSARFVRRTSCCLIYETPSGSLCTSCPRRHPDDRRAQLERATRWF